MSEHGFTTPTMPVLPAGRYKLNMDVIREFPTTLVVPQPCVVLACLESHTRLSSHINVVRPGAGGRDVLVPVGILLLTATPEAWTSDE